MKIAFPFLAVLAVIAGLAAWHGATNSAASRTALYLLPVLLAMGSIPLIRVRKP